MDIDIRKGIKKDLPQVLALIKELADYEKSLDQVDVTLEQLEKDGFDGHPHYYLLVAEEKGEIIGVCFYFIRYSTWKGKVLFLEDFVVKEEYRRKGIGGMLFEETIRIVDKRIPVIAGTGSNNTLEAIEYTNHAQNSNSGRIIGRSGACEGEG